MKAAKKKENERKAMEMQNCTKQTVCLLIINLLFIFNMDSLPERSKGVDSSSTSASCVGSNPTAVIHRCIFVVGKIALSELMV